MEKDFCIILDSDGHFKAASMSDRGEVIKLIKELFDGDAWANEGEEALESVDCSTEIDTLFLSDVLWREFVGHFVQRQQLEIVSVKELYKPSYSPSIINTIDECFKKVIEKGWDKTYWFFDIHSTILKPNYVQGNISTEFYPYAKEVMQMVSKIDDIIVHLYTCSHPDEILQYLDFFKSHDIDFQYVNENPEVKTHSYGCYDKKPYINVLFEDKAGFDGEKDWLPVLNKLKEKYEINE